MYSRDNICSNFLLLLEAQNLSIWCGSGVSIVKELNNNGSQSYLLRILSPSFKADLDNYHKRSHNFQLCKLMLYTQCSW